MNRFYELRNIAVGKPTHRSTRLQTGGSWGVPLHIYYSFYANDGDSNCRTADSKAKFFSSNYESNPFWRVDLQRSAVVLNVTVRNRDDSNGKRINPFYIYVGDTTTNGGRDNPVCAAGATLQQGEMKNFTCPETVGRYVSIQIYRKDYLQLCEVEVYGIYL